MKIKLFLTMLLISSAYHLFALEDYDSMTVEELNKELPKLYAQAEELNDKRKTSINEKEIADINTEIKRIEDKVIYIMQLEQKLVLGKDPNE